MNENKIARRILKNLKSRSLLLLSESCKSYPSIYHFLLRNNTVTDTIIENELSADDLNLVDNLLSEILKLCQDEWVGDSNPVEILDGENRIPCSLCNTPTKEIYYIVNKISRKKINIGSTCIGEFNKDDLLLFGKSKSQLLKDAKVTYRRKIVNDKYPGISKLVSNWDAELHRYPLLIPYALEKPYLEVGLKLKELVKQFINGKAKNEISEFQMLLDERIELLKLMSEYCDENKNKKFITSRSTVEWLMKNGKNSTVEELKKTGFITAQTIPHVLHKEFIEDIKNDIHKLLLEHANTSLVKIDFLKNEFIVQPHIHNKKLLLKISMQKFLDHFGWLLFGITLKNKPRINLYNIFYLGSCYDDETKLTILRDIKQMLSKSKYTLIYEDEDDYYFANNEIDVADLNSNLRNTVQLNNFVESFKMVPYQIGKNSVNDVVSYISDLKSKWQTPSDVKALRKESQRLAN